MFGENVEALDGAGVIDDVTDAAEEVVGFGDEGIALTLFGADGHQADPRRFDAEHNAAIMAAHNRVMDEVLRLGLGIGTGVDQDEVPALTRADRGQSGTGDALHGAKAQRAAGHQGSGVATADDDTGFAVFHEFDGADHRGVFLFLQRVERLVVHRHDFGSVKNGKPVFTGETGVRDEGIQLGLVADERDRVERRILMQSQLDGSNHLGRTEVAAHGVNCYAPAGAGRINHRGDGG